MVGASVEQLGRYPVRDLEAGLGQAPGKVAAVDPDVVLLSEGDHAAERGDDRGILVGGHAWAVGNEDECEAPWGENPVQLAHRGTVVRDVLEDVTAEDQVERGVAQFHVGDVEAEIRGGVQIGGDALDGRQAGEDGIEERLGGEVEEAPSGELSAREQHCDRPVSGM